MPAGSEMPPAASDATNVPCPTLSCTVDVPDATFHVIGFFAAIVGASTSAPVSTTAIDTFVAASCTHDGTRSAWVAVHCHSGIAAPPVVNGPDTLPLSVRATVRCTKRLPG